MSRWLALFGLALAVAYCPFIEGAAVTPRWLLLAAVVPIALLCLALAGRKVDVTMAHIVGAAFMAWAMLSLLWSATPFDSVDAFWKLNLLAGCFVLGSLVDDWRPFLVGTALGLSISSGLLVAELYTGWHIEMLSGAREATVMAALFGNRNYLGEAVALVLVGFFAIEPSAKGWRGPSVPVWVFLGLLPALMLASARGALLALIVAYCAMAWPERLERWRWPAAGAAMGLFCLLAYLWSDNAGITDRLHLWADTLQGLTWFGQGLGSFGGTFALNATHVDMLVVRQPYAHNDLLQIAYELGVPGLMLALGFIGLILRSDRPERFVFLAFTVEMMFAFPSALPFTGAVAFAMAGNAARALPRLCLSDVMGRSLIHAGDIVISRDEK